MNLDSEFTLLFVDDERDILDSLYRSFRKEYNIILCNSGQEAINVLNEQSVDLILSDQRMPEITGSDVLKHAYQKQPEAIRILLTGYSDMGSLVECVNEAQIYKYISKPWEPEDLRLSIKRAIESLHLDRQLQLAHQSLESAYLNAVTMLGSACEGKDETTGNHVRRVQHFTQALATEVGIEEREAIHMGVMSILHDVGKVSIPDEILKKPGKLTEDEWRVMKLHPEHGARILGEHPYYSIAKEIALYHHENFDGSGYPSGIKENDIPLAARITKIADTFDALTTVRPYKEAWDINSTLSWMTEMSGSMFDPELISGMLRLHEKKVLEQIMVEFQD